MAASLAAGLRPALVPPFHTQGSRCTENVLVREAGLGPVGSCVCTYFVPCTSSDQSNRIIQKQKRRIN